LGQVEAGSIIDEKLNA